jgi:hypothetical protein
LASCLMLSKEVTKTSPEKKPVEMKKLHVYLLASEHVGK